MSRFILFLLSYFLLVSNIHAADMAAADLEIFSKLQDRVIEASDKIKNRVVHIEVVIKQNQQNIKVQGSGLILDSAGAIITNEHLVDKAEKVTITVPGIEDKFEADVIGMDKLSDLALLKMQHPLRFEPIKWADISRVRVGEWAVAIGNPYGLDGTVSLGIISAKGRAIPAQGLLNDFIQTDAMIDVGSSGGPLINLKGEVLGINSMIIGRGIGFTIPNDVVQKFIPKLEKGEKIQRSWVGITIQPLAREYAEYFGIPDKRGIIIVGVFEGSPAEKAGFQAGDIIISVDGEEIGAEKEEDLNQFKRKIADHKIGDVVTFEVYNTSKKKFRTVKVTTAEQPTPNPRELDINWGFVVKEITQTIYRENFLFSMSGVVVNYVRNGSEAEIAGLEPWDIIQAVEGFEVKNMDDFEKAYKKVKDKEKVMLRVLRNRDIYYVLLQKYGPQDNAE